MHILKHAVVVFYKRGDFIQNSLWKKNHECFKNVNLILHFQIGECLIFQHCKKFPEPIFLHLKEDVHIQFRSYQSKYSTFTWLSIQFSTVTFRLQNLT